MKLRLVTWNLERSHDDRRWRIPEQRHELEAEAADAYLLTEVDERFELLGHRGKLFSDPGAGRYAATEHASGIWTRLELRKRIESEDSRHVACGIFEKEGQRFILYATIMPAMGIEHVPGDHGWMAHRRSLQAQMRDWAQLRKDYPNYPLVVAGDFNLSLGSSGFYGEQVARESIRRTCVELNLVLATDLDLPRIRENGKDNIDHVLASSDLKLVSGPRLWMPHRSRREKSTFLSDHCGITVDLALT
jgi:endonuclease/exonuclease/phosphatase family metal-dependent hydrolase